MLLVPGNRGLLGNVYSALWRSLGSILILSLGTTGGKEVTVECKVGRDAVK
jgi:hypothetical protein